MIDDVLSILQKSEQKQLVEKIRDVVSLIENSPPPFFLISHYDADGLSAATSAMLLLERLKIPYHLTVVEQLTPEFLRTALKEKSGSMMFLDLGSGMLEYIKSKEYLQIFIVDHHLPQGSHENIIEVNPHRYGVDGSLEVSSSSLSFLMLAAADKEAVEKAHLAIIGALGDRQDQGERFSLTGINEAIAKIAEERGIIETKIGLRLFGAHTRPLTKALALTMDPPLPTLTGKEDVCLKFLNLIGINPVKNGTLRKYSDLSLEEKKVLATELLKLMIAHDYPVNEAERIFGTMYFYAKEPPQTPLRDLREFAYLVNACGRLDYHGTAIGLLRGYRGKMLARALSHVREYRTLLSKALSLARSDKIKKEENNIYIYIDFEDELPPKATGAVASILSSILKTKAKILIVSSQYNSQYVKMSFRKLDNVELNLGEIIADTAKSVNCNGGGHDEAGGALIEKAKLKSFLEEFLSAVQRKVGEQ